jgi:hypothetical protein
MIVVVRGGEQRNIGDLMYRSIFGDIKESPWERTWYSILDIRRFVMGLFRKIKSFYQRGKRGWADEDTWSFYSYLCDMIVPALRYLKDNCHGCPDAYYNQHRENDECHKWKDVLETMAQGFEAAKYLETLQFMKLEDGKFIFDENANRNAVNKMKVGLELFAENFINLWD